MLGEFKMQNRSVDELFAVNVSVWGLFIVQTNTFNLKHSKSQPFAN